MDFADFDPTWSFEQAKAAGDDGPVSPFQRWQAWSLMLEAYRSSFEEGERNSVLEALRLCAIHELPMPEWLSAGYQQCFREWRHLHVKTLDAAFGVTLPKGSHFAAMRKARRLAFAVPALVMRLKRKGMPVDEGLFHEIGKALNVSAGTAKSAYYKSGYHRSRKLPKKS
ncbi:TPA: hypothetical protein NO321_000220 [Pseudomonas aeruginosa]|uniref:hypothetical protein n=1 Tax=Pseudomonas aeruginosa TaxID=287 RepID=UPI000F51EE1A|nr:hypothetical protein [Pseudomonas aeruginosa]MEB5331917.1 hypothetical protein [Pseudomonas aeruginosa]MEB5347299.1 hypothetical protein [Pseudomonas aeruginosa]MEB5428842.1 hypothetical protein [Pseudomonas aeruginosa]HCI3972011.1 hypothetical protein [Pseudomonas aeruginosa]